VFNVAFLALLVGFFAIRLIGPGIVVATFVASLAMMIFTFMISEVMVNRIYRAHKPDQIIDKAFLDIVAKISRHKHMWFKPRTYILQIGVPNAMAYGMGMPGFAAIGVSRELLDLLSAEELEGVIGHEMAHIRCRDVGLMTLIGLMQTLVDKFSKLLDSGKSGWAGSIFVYAIIWIMLQITKGIFSLSRFAISQERELVADALGATYQGSPHHLISALKKLDAQAKVSKENSRPGKLPRSNGPFSDIMISHPGIDERVKSLEAIFSE
jgi:heat shock protein HtpX